MTMAGMKRRHPIHNDLREAYMAENPPAGITVGMSFNALKVCFGDVTHLRIDATKLIGHQSWREGYGNHKFVIEYTTTAGQIICEYDTEDKWKAILAGLDRALDQPNKPA